MIIKLLGSIAVILILLMSLFVILTINSETDINKFSSDHDRFVGKWQLITNETENPETQTPGITGELNTLPMYEIYEFFSNNTYRYIVNQENSSGVWGINDSFLILTGYGPLVSVPLFYEYAFSDNDQRVTLNLVDYPEDLLEFEKTDAV